MSNVTNVTLENAPERQGIVTLKGNAKTLIGNSTKVGDIAPDFSALDGTFANVSLSSFKGKVVLISVVPSLDTPVCSIQTKKFNEELSKLSSDIVAITISNDLPFAQKRFCDAEKTSRTIFLSDSYKHEFGLRYGLIVKDMGILARAVFVIGKDGRIVYQEIVSEITNEPDYSKALEALKKQ
ncbi:MAG: thiol peroxidase [Candidatus Nanoarchaeia archaeon]